MSVFQYLGDAECEAAMKELVRVSKQNAIAVFHVKNLRSLYLTTLLIAKKLKRLIAKRVTIEYYRSYKWYERKFFESGIRIADYNSVNKFRLVVFPKFMLRRLRGFERKCYERRFLRKYGADFKIRAIINKEGIGE